MPADEIIKVVIDVKKRHVIILRLEDGAEIALDGCIDTISNIIFPTRNGADQLVRFALEGRCEVKPLIESLRKIDNPNNPPLKVIG